MRTDSNLSRYFPFFLPRSPAQNSSINSENENDGEESPYFSDENCDAPLTGEGENSSAIDDDADDRARAWSEAVAADSDSGITLSGSRLRNRRTSWEIGHRYKVRMLLIVWRHPTKNEEIVLN